MENNDWILDLILSATLILFIENLICWILRKCVGHPIKTFYAALVSTAVNFIVTGFLMLFLTGSFINLVPGFINTMTTVCVLSCGYKKYFVEKNCLKNTQKYNRAYFKLKCYKDGFYDKFMDEKTACYICDCLYLCSAWCIFHADKEKKEDLKPFKSCLLRKFLVSGFSVEKLIDDYDAFNAHMLNYKKEVIDPEYLKDSSVENYNKLISVFVKEILNITDIKYYPEIFTDFLSCMK